ncbi:MAG TPA: SRPBCC family protein [Acidimicrobiales bacterium]|nr:SRPBCC family protein [Acidimicrobiales bacterium]
MADSQGSQPTRDFGGTGHRHTGEDRLAKALGWFSIALGVPQLIAPGYVNRLIGVNDSRRNRWVMRAVGVRELGGAAGILDRPRPSGFLFARVVGDAMDLLMLQSTLRRKGKSHGRVVAAAAAVVGVAVLDVVASAKTSRSSDPTTAGGAVRARTAITVNRPPEEVYGYWRRFENLPAFMAHLDSVQAKEDGRWRWVAKAPLGRTVEWEAQVEEDVPNQLIAWRSLEGADVPNWGWVRFAPAAGGRATEVTLELEYEPPGRAVGAAVARMFGEEPLQQIKDDVRRFKQVIETGEVVRSDGTPDGARTQRQLFQSEGQPIG